MQFASLRYFTRARSAAVWTVAAIVAGGWSADARADLKPVGINLSSVNYYSTELPFKDYMRSADQWRRHFAYLAYDHPSIDAQGWVKSVAPGEEFESLTLWDLNPEAYQYLGASPLVVRYEGEGSISFQGGYQVASHDVANKRVVLTPIGNTTPTQGVLMKITGVNPANYLRNIHITKPEFENTWQADPWDPTFLNRWQGATSLRFMDWGATNHSPLATWSQRTPESYFTQAGRRLSSTSFDGTGVSYETMIALCNRMDKDLWINVPHQADDNYVTQLATLVNQTLEPGLRVHVEHSNEVWNGIFSQYQYAVTRANALIAQGQTQLDSGAGDFGDAMRYHGQRTKQIGQLFDAVLGAERVTTVLGAFNANSWVTQMILGRVPDTPNYWDPTIRDVVDAVAVGHYVDLSENFTPANLDQLFANINGPGLALARTRMQQQLAAVRAIDPELEYLAYEGGQHLGFNVADPALYIAANRDPRMGAFYDQLLADWYELGGGQFVAFSSVSKYGQYGSWGLLEGHGQDPLTAPKYQSFLRAAGEKGADFDSDGDVDADDLLEWRGDVRVNGHSDADGDGDSDGADFLVWQRQLSVGAIRAAGESVPEPGSAVLVATALLLRRRPLWLACPRRRTSVGTAPG